ncbi:Ribosomal protein arginine N-methyltransferase rmt3 [Colletotrichum siamense]|uniref:Ribosomal protein arginine N-methyltransferase rmt3 n=1 Tax=Colletotrichum siamense TaxID=690259 RepID=UPI0018723371|nr:Ribosomal protein arginine N-methyltransferase rmt3 [Colletotrichum siamense]KAF5487637.1 Ribosomal protein arginine N-methyltransferase rmt3 [Colletotrichum siamense]
MHSMADAFSRWGIGYWGNVCSFNLSNMSSGTEQRKIYINKPQPNHLATRGHRFKAFDLHRMKAENVVFDAPFWMDVETKPDSLDAWMIWYDTFFLTAPGTNLAQSAKGHRDLKQDCVDGVIVATGPHGKVAHWGAGHLPVVRTPTQAPAVLLALGDSITSTVKFGEHRGSPRDVEMTVSWTIRDAA